MKFCAFFLFSGAVLLSRGAQGQTPTSLFVGGTGGSLRTAYGRPEVGGELTAWELKDALGLDANQTSKIATILTDKRVALNALGDIPPRDALSVIRQQAADQIRALLTPQQRMEFNLLRAERGGALIGLSPEEQLDRLDALVHLAPAQKPAVLSVYVAGTENLMENRVPTKTAKSRKLRAAMLQDIRTLLTADQQKIWDATPQAKGGGLVVFSAEHMVERLDAMVRLTTKEKVAARQIYEDAAAELLKIPEPQRSAERRRIRRIAEIKIRALLTTEQLQNWDRANAPASQTAT